MITWFYGQSGAGKTYQAKKLMNATTILLDGDDMRQCWDLGFSKEDRRENNLRIAKIAKLLESQGFNVVVATICPYKDLREEVRIITECEFVYLPGGKETSDQYPFEI